MFDAEGMEGQVAGQEPDEARLLCGADGKLGRPNQYILYELVRVAAISGS